MIDGPLKGLRILDLTHVWAGPLAVRFLSDLGADVVRVEAPTGRGPREFPSDPIGGWLGGAPGDEPWNVNAAFNKLSRNRRSLAIDLKSPKGRATFLELTAVADLVIENFSARTMPGLDLGYEVLKARNPKIIYVHMPGFGASGPLKDRVAFGPTVEVMSGLTTMMGYGPDEPRNTAMALLDPIAATNALAGITIALRRRERTGLGMRMEMSLHEGGVSYCGPWLAQMQIGATPMPLGNAHPAMAPHGIYPCAGTDEWVALACADDAQWEGLRRLLASESGVTLPNLTLDHRLAAREEIDVAISAWTSKLDKIEVAQRAQNFGVAAGPVYTTPDMVADEHVRERGFFVPYEVFNTPMPGNPIHMSELDTSQWTPCPKLGEHNAEVLTQWLGYEASQVQDLIESSVLWDKPPA